MLLFFSCQLSRVKRLGGKIPSKVLFYYHPCKFNAKIRQKILDEWPCADKFSILSGLKCGFCLFFSAVSGFWLFLRKIG